MSSLVQLKKKVSSNIKELNSLQDILIAFYCIKYDVIFDSLISDNISVWIDENEKNYMNIIEKLRINKKTNLIHKRFIELWNDQFSNKYIIDCSISFDNVNLLNKLIDQSEKPLEIQFEVLGNLRNRPEIFNQLANLRGIQDIPKKPIKVFTLNYKTMIIEKIQIYNFSDIEVLCNKFMSTSENNELDLTDIIDLDDLPLKTYKILKLTFDIKINTLNASNRKKN